jgi:hypothetical protein
MEKNMSQWDEPIKGNDTPRDIVIKYAGSRTDKEIASELTKIGFKATGQSVRAARLRMGISKPQGNNSKEDRQYVHGSEWDITLGRTPISTQEELIAAYHIDTRLWEIVEFNISRYEVVHGTQAEGDSTNWQRDVDEWTIVPLNSIKAKLKKRAGVEEAINELEAVKESIKKISPKPITIKRAKRPSDNLLEMCIPDMHFGKVGWSEQTLYEDYDVAIAKNIFQEAVPTLMSRVDPYKFGEILFVVGNDVFHTDNSNNTTYAGTQLDGDTRYHRTFRIVREVMVNTIESLRSVAPVKVLVVPGNHDRMTSWHLGDSLECWFHKYKDVTIDNAPSSRKYHRWGSVLLLFTHGDAGKRQDYPTLMASERPVDWGQTIFREIHTGDKHQVRVEEKFGVRVRILSSLSSLDTWHSEHLFVGNQRQAEAFVWNKQQGLLGTAIYTHQSK